MKKTKAEQELGRQKDKEIERLTQELNEHSAVVKQQKEEIARYSVYQKFMERALDYSDEVNNITQTHSKYFIRLYNITEFETH